HVFEGRAEIELIEPRLDLWSNEIAHRRIFQECAAAIVAKHVVMNLEVDVGKSGCLELFADGLHRESLSRRLLESPGNRGSVVLQTELTHEVEDLRKRTTERKRDDSLAAAVQETRGF